MEEAMGRLELFSVPTSLVDRFYRHNIYQSG